MSQNNSVNLKLIDVQQDSANLNYVVRAKVYPEDPNSLFLTMRGQDETGANGGVSVYDVSNPQSPRFLTHWNAKTDLDNTVEGQDRVDNILAVVAINMGKLYLFDVSNPSTLSLLTAFTLSDLGMLQKFKALHLKIYQTGGKNYALITAPSTSRLVAVDITDPTNPKQISSVNLGFTFLLGQGAESVYLKDHYAYCGAFNSVGVASNKFVVVNVSDVSNMKVVKDLKNDDYNQMVSEIDPANSNILYSSAWGKPGGLIAFDLSNPAAPVETSRVINSDFNRSNRVKIKDNFAYIPLEQDIGGVGIINIADPHNLSAVTTVTGITDPNDSSKKIETPYALEVKDDYLYVFGTTASTMAIMQIVAS